MLPSGSTDLSGIPSMNHHGTPLSMGTIVVPGPTKTFADWAAVVSAVALTARISTSAGPSKRISSALRVASPSLISTQSSAPRLVSAITDSPASASFAATQPPMAPAPITQMFTGGPMG